MISPLEGMGRNAARQQVKVFTADSKVTLEMELNSFLMDLQADQVIDGSVNSFV